MSRDIVDISTPFDWLVVAVGIEGEPADQLACVLIEDPDVAVGDQQLDRPALCPRRCTARINREQRDGIYELVRNHLAGLGACEAAGRSRGEQRRSADLILGENPEEERPGTKSR
jgi:hypothetical protein